MTKHNKFVLFLKKINLLTNNLLEKYLNKLNYLKISNIAKSNKLFLSTVILIILFLSYLSIPHVYNNHQIQKKIENHFSNNFDLNLIINKSVKYKLFPLPHFRLENSTLLENKIKISNIEKVKIFISIKNLFSLDDIKLTDINLINANFNLDRNNYRLFINLLKKKFFKCSFKY